MGLTLEFALGDPDKISEAVKDYDFDRLSDPAVVKGRADLSLHITPHDLDALSEEFASASGREAVKLRPYLQVLHDDSECGALLVDRFWISYAAAVPLAQAKEITQRWIARMSREYEEPQIVFSEGAMKAVGDLIALCARAEAEGESLVHLWSL